MSAPMLLTKSDENMVYFGPPKDPRRTRYWAERGIIHVEDTDTGEFETLSLREFLQRMDGVSEFVAKLIQKDRVIHADEITRQQRFLEQAEVLCRRAKFQGLPPRLGGGLRREYVGSTTVVPRVLGSKYVF